MYTGGLSNCSIVASIFTNFFSIFSFSFQNLFPRFTLFRSIGYLSRAFYISCLMSYKSRKVDKRSGSPTSRVPGGIDINFISSNYLIQCCSCISFCFWRYSGSFPKFLLISVNFPFSSFTFSCRRNCLACGLSWNNILCMFYFIQFLFFRSAKGRSSCIGGRASFLPN